MIEPPATIRVRKVDFLVSNMLPLEPGTRSISIQTNVDAALKLHKDCAGLTDLKIGCQNQAGGSGGALSIAIRPRQA